ncbi:MAG: hypothetical protein ACYC56_13725 [Candidatus Aquicultor sp.]
MGTFELNGIEFVLINRKLGKRAGFLSKYLNCIPLLPENINPKFLHLAEIPLFIRKISLRPLITRNFACISLSVSMPQSGNNAQLPQKMRFLTKFGGEAR